MLVLTKAVHDEIVAACLDAWPLEACGLIAGPPPRPAQSEVTATVNFPATNAAASARIYTVAPPDVLRADREAEAAGLVLLGVWHSHTHTDALPSPTDVAQAPDPDWHYVIVSLRDSHPVIRSYRIARDGDEQRQAVEEPVALQ